MRITIKLILLTILTVSTWVCNADEISQKVSNKFPGYQPGIAPVKNSNYIKECSSCHFAYQPGLLPSRSWKKIMSDLENHFGDNAELDIAVQKELLRYMMDNGADRSDHRRSKKIMRSIENKDTPLRITKVRYFRHKHEDLPKRMVEGNPKVTSLGNCGACHTQADTGSFLEGEINIPGFGNWDE